MSGDNLQDLKTGHIVGATPFKQQIMQGVGVIAAAAVAAPTLTLLLNAYGIGVPTETHPDPLAAPQATLMASVARGVFEGGLPIGMVIIGMVVAVAVIALDLYLERVGSGFRTPVLALAVGIYLPFELSVPIAIGGLIAHFAAGIRGASPDNGVLFSAGRITGEALIGIGMAVPIVIYGRPDVLAFWGVHEGNIPGLALLVVVAFLLYRSGTARAEV
jgi:putative OPT family oligopeptide transporter